MQVIEQTTIPKNPHRAKNEDGLVVTKDFIAVVDGSTSKSALRHSLFRSNGRYAMQLICRYIRKAPANLTCDAFCRGVTAYVRKHYKKSMTERLMLHPEDRLTASAIVFSRLNREVWMIGDCHCMIGDEYYDNPKPYEDELAEKRSVVINQLLQQGATINDILADDKGRAAVIPTMLQHMQQQNKGYAVIDGFPIPQQHVRVIALDFEPWEIVMASDGYPWLRHTLKETEDLLLSQKTADPLNIHHFKATKAFLPQNRSFDDRTYIRFKV